MTRRDPTELRRSRCRDCGAEVDTVTAEYGLDVHLNTTPPPITVDITAPEYRHRVWQYLGPRIGWRHMAFPARTWREIRTTHRCGQIEREHESERKNTKENKR